jgi:hypothetical protein
LKSPFSQTSVYIIDGLGGMITSNKIGLVFNDRFGLKRKFVGEILNNFQQSL